VVLLHPGVASSRQHPDGTAAGTRSVDVRLRRRGGNPAVCRRRGSDACPRARRTLLLDVERYREIADDVERIRCHDAATAITSRNTGYITTAG